MTNSNEEWHGLNEIIELSAGHDDLVSFEWNRLKQHVILKAAYAGGSRFRKPSTQF